MASATTAPIHLLLTDVVMPGMDGRKPFTVAGLLTAVCDALDQPSPAVLI